MVASSFHEQCLPASDRARVVAACYGIVQEHHHAIVILVGQRLNSAGFSLLRSAFEAYVRGSWLLYCASDCQVTQFLSCHEPPKINSLLAALALIPDYAEGKLSQIKSQGWKTMCAYTHTGGLHVQRWNVSQAV